MNIIIFFRVIKVNRKSDIICSVNGLTKIEDNKVILNDISFQIPKNQVVGFLGPNGAGKTTTLRVLSGLTRYTRGKILINNIESSKEKSDKVMFLPDIPLLFPVLTGREYLKFIGEILNIKINEEEIYVLVKKLKLIDALDSPISKYSLGMKKKLSLLPLLIKKPPLLLLDEYISGIDPVSMKEIKDILKGYASDDKSILLSTHQLEVAQTFCDSIIFIKEGEISQNYISVKEIIDKEKSLEEYFIKCLK
ncbi:hypothetical protein COO13_22380 [Bacillus toyonensis]|nr:hypothetical protein COO13_22380 [Bacillus toyonensis]